MSKTVVLQRRDRPWVGSVLSLLLGPVDMPSTDEVRAAVRRVAAANPHARIGWRLDRDALRWIPGEPTDDMVREVDLWSEDAEIGDVVDGLVAEADEDLPLQFVRFPDHLGMIVRHALSDGRSNGAIIEAVAAEASAGHHAPVASHPSGRAPMLSAVWGAFGRDPKRLRSAFADRPERRAVPAAGVEIPWQPARKTLYTSLDGPSRDETLAEVKRVGGKVSNFAVTATVVIRALHEAGIAVSPVSNVVVDLRTYLGGDWINGNFLGSLPIRIDENTTVTEVSQQIRSGMRTARPLAGGLLSSAKTGGRRHRPTVPTTADPGAATVVTFSDVGMRTDIPFASGGKPLYASSNEPDGPNGLTIVGLHTAEASMLSASFHDNVIDPGRVAAALKLLTHDFGRLARAEGAR
ncbi:hypothetical protein FOV72_14045 [Gordonia rubripertincta]|uniref:hypothetical protein n=1 Tax=Gordonia rubripertincta TaxID=36822 RepID=UPI001180D54B|nr:hypothetical protein [Gordonia rubripertincta]TSD95447.1 hypothetical protein FOV72_14045 [Gordonia rubripertincta]